jgi:hypothetical protein
MRRRHSTPLVCQKTWQTVMDAAGGRCQCPGGCGHAHARTGTACPRTRWDAVLSIASADLTLSDVGAASVPTAQLLVWCEGCRKATTTAQRKARAAETPAPAGLFDFEATA